MTKFMANQGNVCDCFIVMFQPSTVTSSSVYRIHGTTIVITSKFFLNLFNDVAWVLMWVNIKIVR